MVLRKPFQHLFTVALLAGCCSPLAAQQDAASQANAAQATPSAQEAKLLSEPVFRVSKLLNEDKPGEQPAGDVTAKPDTGPAERLAANPFPAKPAAHPLDNALEMADNSLQDLQTIRDYTATLVKRERYNGTLGEREYMKVKIRNERTVDGKQIPFSIYMRFMQPKAVAGREVIWVKGQNEGKILAHETGVITGFKTFHLDPDGMLAMRNNRHPIYEAGLENLVLKLIEKAERDKAAGLCKVEYRKGAKIKGRACTMISVTHDVQKAPYDFHNAQVFIDDELNIPIRYASYDWPSAPGEEAPLIEEYTYLEVQVNVGLTDKDFDPANEEYAFPGY
ncbi:MAG: DUF1571 domain-containing protein [Planctomycetota bacterium]|jgi:hypothetical protein